MKKFEENISLFHLYPVLSEQWDYKKNYPLTPKNAFAHSRAKVWWKCSFGHEWSARIGSRTRRIGVGCPYCSGHEVDGDNCLSAKRPLLAREWHPTKNKMLTPNDVTMGSNKKVWWMCLRGHEYKATIINRNNNCGCPYCSGKKICQDNCLEIINPSLAKEWNFIKNGKLTPHTVSPYSSKKVWWECSRGHEWEANIYSRSAGNGCPYCDKIELKDGAICDSLPEAYYYLKLKEQNVAFDYHVSIGLGKCICDFYLQDNNTYIEVTSFRDDWRYWKTYYQNILRKQTHIVNSLKANFEFVRLPKLSSKQIEYVRANAI